MEKIKSASLWHVTPVSIGMDFYNPTISTLTVNEELYRLVSPCSDLKIPNYYSRGDFTTIKKFKSFNKEFLEKIQKSEVFENNKINYVEVYPDIKDCFGCYKINDDIYLYFLANGLAVFFEKGKPIELHDEKHFSYDLFRERKIYEDDFCGNAEVSDRKKIFYQIIDIMWETVGKNRKFTATKDFEKHGIPYTLCIEVVDLEKINLSRISDDLKRNLLAMNTTSPFANILNDKEKDDIVDLIDNLDISNFSFLPASDSLLFMDSWAGVVLAGDISSNIETALAWIEKFEIYLQGQWCFFNCVLEDSLRKDLSHLELRELIDIAKYEKVELENDITSTMEQIRKQIRLSLISSSEINVIYGKMMGILENRYNLKSIQNERKKNHFSMFSDFMLLLIALFQIYTVIEAFVYDGFEVRDLIPISVVLGLALIGMFFIIKSKKD